MPTSSDLPSDMIDWFQVHPTVQPREIRERSPQAESFLTHLWPMSMSYHSPLRPRFLIELEKEGLEGSSETFLVRDGLVPLLWFWKKFPQPGSFQGKLVVGDAFAEHVPEAWRARTLYYRLAADPKRAARRPAPKRLILLGLVMPGYVSVEALKERLSNLKFKGEIYAFLPARFAQCGSQRLEFHFSFIQEVCKALGTGIRSVNWGFVDAMDHWADAQVLNLCDGMLLNDCFVVHSLLSRGAGLHPASQLGAGPGAIGKGARFVPVSPYHGYWISEKTLGKGLKRRHSAQGEQELSALSEALQSPANQYFPWPTWFDDFCASL